MTPCTIFRCIFTHCVSVYWTSFCYCATATAKLPPICISFQAFEELERLLSNRSICVAVKEKLTKDSGVAGAGDYDHIVEKLMAKPKARGIIHLLFALLYTLNQRNIFCSLIEIGVFFAKILENLTVL